MTTTELLTPSQRARRERDARVLSMYEEEIAAGEEKPSIVAVCDFISHALGISKTTVYNIIRERENGREASNDDDQQ